MATCFDCQPSEGLFAEQGPNQIWRHSREGKNSKGEDILGGVGAVREGEALLDTFFPSVPCGTYE